MFPDRESKKPILNICYSLMCDSHISRKTRLPEDNIFVKLSYAKAFIEN